MRSFLERSKISEEKLMFGRDEILQDVLNFLRGNLSHDPSHPTSNHNNNNYTGNRICVISGPKGIGKSLFLETASSVIENENDNEEVSGNGMPDSTLNILYKLLINININFRVCHEIPLIKKSSALRL